MDRTTSFILNAEICIARIKTSFSVYMSSEYGAAV